MGRKEDSPDEMELELLKGRAGSDTRGMDREQLAEFLKNVVGDTRFGGQREELVGVMLSDAFKFSHYPNHGWLAPRKNLYPLVDAESGQVGGLFDQIQRKKTFDWVYQVSGGEVSGWKGRSDTKLMSPVAAVVYLTQAAEKGWGIKIGEYESVGNSTDESVVEKKQSPARQEVERAVVELYIRLFGEKLSQEEIEEMVKKGKIDPDRKFVCWFGLEDNRDYTNIGVMRQTVFGHLLGWFKRERTNKKPETSWLEGSWGVESLGVSVNSDGTKNCYVMVGMKKVKEQGSRDMRPVNVQLGFGIKLDGDGVDGVLIANEEVHSFTVPKSERDEVYGDIMRQLLALTGDKDHTRLLMAI